MNWPVAVRIPLAFAFGVAACTLMGYLLLASLRVPQAGLPLLPVTMGEHTVIVEVASTPREISRGLQFRPGLERDAGMLFIFERPVPMCFWMKDTFVPLDAAFVSASGKIIHIAQMRPLSKELHCPPAEALAVVEMNQGWFERNRVGLGVVVALPAGLGE